MARGISGSYGTDTGSDDGRRSFGLPQSEQPGRGVNTTGWGWHLDPNSGQIPGWEPGEPWPTAYTPGDEYMPLTNSPGQYVQTGTDASEISVGIGASNAVESGSIPLQRFPGSGEGLYSVSPNLAPEQFQSEQQVSNFGPVGDFINRFQEQAS